MPPDQGSRLAEISAELKQILEVRIAELTTAMRSAEQTTRQVVSAEMEIARYKELTESLGTEMGDLKRELTALRARAEDVRGQHGGLASERDSLRSEVHRLEREVRESDGEAERLRARARTLEEEGETLRRENDSLKYRIKSFEDNIARMRKLKEELMMSLSGLTAQAASLQSGKE